MARNTACTIFIAPVEDKIRESRLRWFDHNKWRPFNDLVRKVDVLDLTYLKKGRGNLDEKVTERVLYEILIQAGYLVDLHLPRDKESNNHKGYAFAEYETEEVANYAVKLFSGLVRLCNKTLRFAMAGQDKSSYNSASPAANKPSSSSIRRPRPVGAFCGNYSEESLPLSIIHKDAVEKHSIEPAFHHSASGDLVAKGLSNGNFEYSRRVIGSMINGAARAGARNLIDYTSY